MIQDSKSWNETTYYYDIIQIPVNTFCQGLNSLVASIEEYIVNTVEHLILACVLYVALCILLYLAATRWKLFTFTRDMRNARRILFVTAHPDDEVMFFGPTLMHYAQKQNCTVYLLCLSSGKNYGMDKIRTNELFESCKLLGMEQENVFVYNNTNLPDSMDVRWPLELVSKHILYYVEAFDITNLVTFDRYGISGHPNHCSIYYAVANLVIDRQLPKNCGVFVLESVNIFRKYWLVLDLPLSLILSRFRYMKGFSQRKVIHRAMRKHKSQMVWFRRLYMCVSRYMLINTLQQMNLVDIELDLELED
ncbi:N-acetylglucosaminyl-phosphatidylinositol de-N-acetylase [Cylas formicarius]|uniref:N-acetylglucosaminyl-phosphatidylinositol de-N-acetylase n=1 Tax=Cylas formicarius TaxID=197179 RepID=UPI002958C4B2|nr:N-acetylglucosaminyl-phosphatidylinositol de-N-acetylase [Cylas formicarius]